MLQNKPEFFSATRDRLAHRFKHAAVVSIDSCDNLKSEFDIVEPSLRLESGRTVSDAMSERGQRESGRSQPLPPIPPETMSMNIHLNMQHAAMQQTMRMMNVIREYIFL